MICCNNCNAKDSIITDHLTEEVVCNQCGEIYEGKIYEESNSKTLPLIDEEYLPQITLELKDKIDQCIENQNGNHVIQKLIDRIDIKENDEIYEVVYNNLISLSKHTYGCRVIQTLLKKCNEQMVEKMLKKISIKL